MEDRLENLTKFASQWSRDGIKAYCVTNGQDYENHGNKIVDLGLAPYEHEFTKACDASRRAHDLGLEEISWGIVEMACRGIGMAMARDYFEELRGRQ